MTVAKKIVDYFKKNKVKYETITHPVAYTAQEIAAAEHVPGKQAVKSVLIKADDKYVLAVLPATHLVDFEKLKNLIGCKEAALATEEEIANIFPDFEVGAMPPFGNLYDLPVYAEEALKEDEEIVFNAGTHADAVKIKLADFERLAKPKIAGFGKRT